MELDVDPILFVIIGCEIGFWLLLFGGLSVRYLLKRPRWSRPILLAIPILDLALLTAVAVDIHGGGEVTSIHRLAGIYLGVTIAFGHSMIAWADARFANWFADGPPPPKPPTGGMPKFWHEARVYGRWLIAAAIASVATLLLSVTVADPEQRAELFGIFPMLAPVTVIWLIVGPVWALLAGRDDDRHGGDSQRIRPGPDVVSRGADSRAVDR
ncbi:hypothetical protein [Gordonia soli]|uniref:Uncharacterized protein n=1 Tax=Gordonia soli NBRC 108243 TaxID=1223545 RepID=M0QRJ3_9ACTN|nr:hypothetical protein [Gordonia soli]GAC70961.1 hypothetical protein GS4_45_00170 [Gordonia soli NBRC 108243]